MRAADLVVGKPGGLTVAEVLACGRPLLAARSWVARKDSTCDFSSGTASVGSSRKSSCLPASKRGSGAAGGSQS